MIDKPAPPPPRPPAPPKPAVGNKPDIVKVPQPPAKQPEVVQQAPQNIVSVPTKKPHKKGKGDDLDGNIMLGWILLMLIIVVVVTAVVVRRK